MANIRIANLSDKDREKLNLLSLILETNFGYTELLRDVERTGKIPDYWFRPELSNVISPEFLKEAESVVSRLPTRTKALELEAQKKPELGKLTDAELIERREILGEAGKGETRIDRERFISELKGALERQGVSETNLAGKIATKVADATVKEGRFPSENEFFDMFGGKPATVTEKRLKHKLRANDPDKYEYVNVEKLPEGGANLVGFIRNKTNIDYFTNLALELKKIPVTPGEPEAIGDLLTGREAKRTQEKGIEDFLSALPPELAKSREPYLESLRAGGRKEFERSRADIEQTANIRGGLYSGDVEDLLSTSAFGIQSMLDAISANLEEQDNRFFFDAGYRNQIRKTLEASENLGKSIGIEREKFLGEQQYRFNVAQGKAAALEEENLARRGYERQLRSREARLRRQSDYESNQSRKSLYRGLGSAAGAVGGAYVGGPEGAFVGSQIGGELGGQVG